MASAASSLMGQQRRLSSREPLPYSPRMTLSDLPKHGVDVYGTMSEDEQASHLPSQHSANGNSKRHKQKIKFQVLDEAKLGDYERSPSYQCSSMVTFATPTVSKYSGDYERDPEYMRRLFDPSVPHRIPCPGEVLEGRGMLALSEEGHEEEGCGLPEEGRGRTDKYRGEYERSETYVLPPEGGGSSRYLLGKYRGDYERNPVYMENLLAAGKGVVPPSHEYTTLAATTRQAPQPYVTTLTQQPDRTGSPHSNYGDQPPSLGGALADPPHSKHSQIQQPLGRNSPGMEDSPHPPSTLTQLFPTTPSSDKPHPPCPYPLHNSTNQSSTSLVQTSPS